MRNGGAVGGLLLALLAGGVATPVLADVEEEVPDGEIPLEGLVPFEESAQPALDTTQSALPTEGVQSEYEVIEAHVDDRAPAPLAPSEMPRTRYDVPRVGISVAVRAGVFVSFQELGAGPAFGLSAAIDLGDAMGVLPAGQLELRADIGWSRLSYTRPAIVPGRGFDAGFTQESYLVPVALLGVWHLSLGPDVDLYFAAGGGFVWDETRFTAFSAPADARSVGPQGLFGAGLQVPAGAGRVGFELLMRVSGVDLAPLGPVGDESLTGLDLAAFYRFDF